MVNWDFDSIDELSEYFGDIITDLVRNRDRNNGKIEMTAGDGWDLEVN